MNDFESVRLRKSHIYCDIVGIRMRSGCYDSIGSLLNHCFDCVDAMQLVEIYHEIEETTSILNESGMNIVIIKNS